MPSAKDNFIERIELFDKAVNSEPVSTKPFNQIEHNSLANLFRNGLAVLGFTILEDFIKNRIGEVFKLISAAAVPFSRLPIKIQEATTLNAIKSIQFRAGILKSSEEDWMTFVQNETKFTGSTMSLPYELSAFSLGWDKSNLSKEDISTYLSFLGVEGGWNTLQQLSIKGNITLASPSETFKNAATRRHTAAHNPGASSPISDLIDYANQARIIAFCLDALITRSAQFIKANDLSFLSSIKKTKHTDIALRFLIKQGNVWKEFSETSTRALRVNSDLTTLIGPAKVRAEHNKETILVKDSSNKITDWYFYNS